MNRAWLCRNSEHPEKGQLGRSSRLQENRPLGSGVEGGGRQPGANRREKAPNGVEEGLIPGMGWEGSRKAGKKEDNPKPGYLLDFLCAPELQERGE